MRVEEYRRDGLTYRLVAKQVGSTYVGTWACLDCRVDGQTSGKDYDLDGAMAAARALLFSVHHSTIHVHERSARRKLGASQ